MKADVCRRWSSRAICRPLPRSQRRARRPRKRPEKASGCRATAFDGAPYRESASSPPVSVLAEDRRAPAPPANLVAVQEGAAVRLFWDPGPERDVAGYRVYRNTDAAVWLHVGPERVDRPLYLDGDVRPGQRLAYRVTALDQADPPNESRPSAEVELVVGIEPDEGGGER
jgi:hypothetical protein